MAIPLGTLATRQTSGRPCAEASQVECTTTIWARRCGDEKAPVTERGVIQPLALEPALGEVFYLTPASGVGD